ncbi:MAG: glycosyltransferase family A protein [Dehalococcoidia bacterium]|nr:glycosyltransferase family A protein [Dehalococcoidia bacterium]
MTIIVPTYNRATSLADTLHSLMAQDYPRQLLDMIVVDNSSTDDTKEVVLDAQRVSPFPLRYFRKENRGPAASRNYGIERSSARVLAFTDSDCQIPPEWVLKGVARLGPGVGLVAGPVRPVNTPERLPAFFSHQTDHGEEDYRYATANVFYARDAIERCGGFDERFGCYPWGTPVGGEDTDLAWRVKRAGYRSVFVADNPVYHEATDMPMLTWLIEPVRAQILPRLVKDLPELRDRLWARYFISRSAALFYPALAGALVTVARRHPAPLLLALPWLWDQRSMIERDIRYPRRWWRIGVKYGLTAERYLVQSAALAYASLRHRTLVL